MDYLDILKRSLRISFKYRALWIFGFFLALCGGGGGGGGQGFNGGSNSFDGDQSFGGPFDLNPNISENTIILIILGAVCLVAFLIILSLLVQGVTRTSLIGMVNQIEETGSVTIKEGWKIGWSRKAVTVLLITLLIGVPLTVLLIGLFLVALSPLALILFDNDGLTILGIVIMVALLLLWIFVMLLLSVVVQSFQTLSWRYAVLHNTDTIASIKASYHLIRQNLKDVGITLLLLVGIKIVWGILSLVLTLFVLIIAVIVGGIPGLIAYLITQEVWIAVAAGLPLFLVVMIIPLVFASGLYLIFVSSVWTLTFRELTLPKNELVLPEETVSLGEVGAEESEGEEDIIDDTAEEDVTKNEGEDETTDETDDGNR